MTKDREKRQDRARELWSEGKTVKEICEIMQLEYMTVRNYVVDMPDWESRKKKPSTKRKIESMLEEGYSVSDIAEITGTSKSVIKSYKSQLNIKIAAPYKKQNNCIPTGFYWKWPVTVNLLLKKPQPVPDHDPEAERKYLQPSKRYSSKGHS